MNEQFHESKRLGKDTLLPLLQRRNQPALFRFVVMYGLFLACCWGIVEDWDQEWWWLALSLTGFGIMTCSLFACEHETVHQTAFKSRFLNRLAAFLVGLAHFYPSTAFRELHFTHHRYTHVPGKDPEISLGNRPMPSVIANLPAYLGWMTGLPLLLFKIGMTINGALGMVEPVRKNLYPFVRPQVRWALMAECWAVLAAQGGCVLAALYWHPGFWGLFIGQVIGHCMLAGYLTPEHNGLPHEGNIFEKTRSMKTNAFIKLLMWNMPYHAEHHAYPAVPFHALPALHREVREDILHKEESHADFHRSVVQKTITGK